MFGVLRESDILAMRSDVARIIADNPADIEIRRGNTTLPAQRVRVEKAGLPGGTAIGRSGVLVQRKSSCTVLGAIDLDIEVEDRFTWGGIVQGEFCRT